MRLKPLKEKLQKKVKKQPKQQKRQLKNQLRNNNSPLIVIGLGNPGREYAETRHNAGFMVLDLLAQRLNLRFRKRFLRAARTTEIFHDTCTLVLVKPLTYMNKSGEILSWLLKKYKSDPGRILIIVDHLDLPCGSLRLKRRGSSGGQRGLESIIRYLGTEEFPRVHIGIGKPRRGTSIIDHVLGVPSAEEAENLAISIQNAADAVLRLCRDPIDKVMNDVNRRPPV